MQGCGALRPPARARTVRYHVPHAQRALPLWLRAQIQALLLEQRPGLEPAAARHRRHGIPGPGVRRRRPRPARPREIDLVPIPISLGTDKDARPAEPVAIAELLATAVRATALKAGSPGEVLVRHAAIGAAAADLISHLIWGKQAPPRGLSASGTWKGWGLPPPLLAEIFRAAARFHRAQPWRLLENEDLLDFESPAGSRWTLCVLGAAAEEFGLVLRQRRAGWSPLLVTT